MKVKSSRRQARMASTSWAIVAENRASSNPRSNPACICLSLPVVAPAWQALAAMSRDWFARRKARADASPPSLCGGGLSRVASCRCLSAAQRDEQRHQVLILRAMGGQQLLLRAEQIALRIQHLEIIGHPFAIAQARDMGDLLLRRDASR